MKRVFLGWLGLALLIGQGCTHLEDGLPPPVMPPSARARAVSQRTLPVGAPLVPPVAEAWADAIVLTNRAAVAVVVPSLGRLVHFAAGGGTSMFRCDPALVGKTPDETGDTFFNIGGDWLWPVPQAHWPAFSEHGNDWPPPAAMRDAAWRVVQHPDDSVTLIREYGEPLNIVASRTFALHPATEAAVATLSIHQQITRTAHSEIPVVLWNVSQIAGAEMVVLPLAERSAFKSGVKVLAGEAPPEDVLRINKEARMAVYFVRPGAEVKLGTDAGAMLEAVAAHGRDQVISEVAMEPQGFPAMAGYPDGGCSHEVYVNAGLGYSEIETLSPEYLLPAGETIANRLVITVDAP